VEAKRAVVNDSPSPFVVCMIVVDHCFLAFDPFREAVLLPRATGANAKRLTWSCPIISADLRKV
tara:strand:- start:141 stop:332 length:192 start_codon:yes stop_codon:yes gene_type:complete